MSPQLYLTMYKEHFRSPGRAKKAELRPTSAHRRNNPQPRPDFLFPRSLRSSCRPTRTILPPSTPVDTGRTLFPPVNHSSAHNPVSAFPEKPLGKTNSDSPHHMPPIKTNKLQLIETPAASDGQLPTSLRSPNKTADYQRDVNPLSARQLSRPQTGVQFQTRPQTSNPPAAAAAPLCCVRTPYRKCCSARTQDFSDCYSCFHVVRPYQAAHYVIHPEFVSESLY